MGGFSNCACIVRPSGDVNDYGIGVDNSYGRQISLNAVTNLAAFITTTTGDVSHAGNTSICTYSYGQSYIIKVRFTTRIILVLYMKGAIKYEIY